MTVPFTSNSRANKHDKHYHHFSVLMLSLTVKTVNT